MDSHPRIILKILKPKIVNKPNPRIGISYGIFYSYIRLSFDDLRMQFDNRIK